MKPPPNPAETDSEIVAKDEESVWQERFAKCNTLGEMLRLMEEDSLRRLSEHVPEDFHKKLSRQMLRFFEPWPDWVLRIAAEVCHVPLPTIPKSTIEDALRFVHFILLEARTDASNKEAMPKLPELNPQIMGALVGHVLANSLYLRKRIEELKDVIPAERLAELSTYFPQLKAWREWDCEAKSLRLHPRHELFQHGGASPGG